MKKIILTIAAILSMSTMAYAIPALQLDIVGGAYNTTTETIIAPSSIFTLNALLNEDKDNTIGDTYFLSAALLPSTNIASNYGSIKINNIVYNVTADMIYGTPPVDALFPDLGSHGIFADFYKEISFVFPSSQFNPYNSQDNPGSTPTAGTGMYVTSFDVDISGLNAGLGIHFDLYNEDIFNKYNKDGSLKSTDYSTQFAPFSHDAEGSNTPVPEPGTMMLLGVGMLGLAVFGKRRMNKNV